MEKLLSVEDVAEVLGVKKSWVYNKVRTNQIPHIKLSKYVRFSEQTLEKFQNSQMRGPKF